MLPMCGKKRAIFSEKNVFHAYPKLPEAQNVKPWPESWDFRETRDAKPDPNRKMKNADPINL